MALSDRQITYRDDLVYEYAALTREAFGSTQDPRVDLQSSDVCTTLQAMVDDFRAEHPDADRTVKRSIGFDRPGRRTSF